MKLVARRVGLWDRGLPNPKLGSSGDMRGYLFEARRMQARYPTTLVNNAAMEMGASRNGRGRVQTVTVRP
jgi:hypothetical protein